MRFNHATVAELIQTFIDMKIEEESKKSAEATATEEEPKKVEGIEKKIVRNDQGSIGSIGSLW